MKVYDIIDKREIPAKKITIAHEGGAYELAREYCGNSLYLHLPTIEGETVVVKWFGTDETAVIVKPARVVEERDPLLDLYEKAKIDESVAWSLFITAKTKEEMMDSCKRWVQSAQYLDGVIDAIIASNRSDIFKNGNEAKRWKYLEAGRRVKQ